MLPTGDTAFVQIVDAALADSARRSGSWLVCCPGCNQCCVGVFAISALDAERLRDGLAQLQVTDPAAAQRVEARVAASLSRLRPDFPGDFETGLLAHNEDAQEQFASYANDEVCPVLDPATGTCDLYASRPLTCRTFGPPVHTEEGGLGMCELCFVGAPEQAILAAEMYLPAPEIEACLIAQIDGTDAIGETDEIGEMSCAGETLIALALRPASTAQLPAGPHTSSEG